MEWRKALFRGYNLFTVTPQVFNLKEDDLDLLLFNNFMLFEKILNSPSHFLLTFNQEDYNLITYLLKDRSKMIKSLVETKFWELSIWDKCGDLKTHLSAYEHYVSKMGLPSLLKEKDKDELYKKFIDLFSNVKVHKRNVKEQSSRAKEKLKEGLKKLWKGDEKIIDNIVNEIGYSDNNLEIFSIEKIYTAEFRENFMKKLGNEKKYYELIKIAKKGYFNVINIGNPEITNIANLIQYSNNNNLIDSLINFAKGLLEKNKNLRKIFEDLKKGKVEEILNNKDFQWYKNIYRNLFISKIAGENIEIKYI